MKKRDVGGAGTCSECLVTMYIVVVCACVCACVGVGVGGWAHAVGLDYEQRIAWGCSTQ